jgi:hypothetical protein
LVRVFSLSRRHHHRRAIGSLTPWTIDDFLVIGRAMGVIPVNVS